MSMLSAALLLLASTEGATTSPPAAVARLPKGAQLELMVLREVDSNAAKPGDPVRFMLTAPVILSDGTVLADKGIKASGSVLESKKAGAALQRGTIRVALSTIALAHGDLPVSGEIQRKGKGGKADDVLKVGLVPFYALFAPGNAAKLKAGETVVAVTSADLCLSSSPEFQPSPCEEPPPPLLEAR